MDIRRFAFGLMLLLTLLFAVSGLIERGSPTPLLPGLDAARVTQIEVTHGTDLLLLVRGRKPDSWQIRSAADAPGDALRIDDLLQRLADLHGEPLPPGAAAAVGKAAATVRLRDRSGQRLAEVEFRDGLARALPDGPELAIRTLPPLPLWASAWSSLRPPVLPLDRVARVARLTPAGLQPLSDRDAAKVARVLSRLSAHGFRPGTDIDWSGDRLLRVQFADGARLDVAQAPDGEGHYFIRLASDDLPTVKAAERFAFRSAESLP